MEYYPVVIEQNEGGFAAYAPDLPGCVAFADTLEEVHRLILEGVEIHCEELEKDGLPPPAPYSSRPVGF